MLKMDAFYQRTPKKRPRETVDCQRPTKRASELANDLPEKIYKFRVLLPDGTSLDLKVRQPRDEMSILEFVDNVKKEYFRVKRQTESPTPKKKVINWKSEDLHFVDAFENIIRNKVNFKNFKPNKNYILRLQDGSGPSRGEETYENLWDLTPDTELLMELPEEYTFETALADLIDNSLQAVWTNGANDRRLISVKIDEDTISIFDTGPGMDGSEENSIVKWGKMGASLHRASRDQAIGGKPPYLMPFFGMFGYGGPIASMHLGRRALVSSKTKESKKVYILHLERDALLSSSGSEQTWRTNGGLRDPLKDELQKSRNGCFTKVEIFQLKMRSLDIVQLQCRLKDIYFPYIQCDEVSNSSRTIMPVEFQVNGIDLAEIQGGEVATTNLHSCNGPDFVLQLHFHFDRDIAAMNSPRHRMPQEANARLKCVYFPIIEGKESIESILEKLEAKRCGIREKYENFSRVSVRRLGRLLPDARWAWLPFMEPRQRKGDKAQILKRCCFRVKCFIETDAGFNPTPSKTDLAHHHPYTTALKNFGSSRPLEKENEVHVEIYKDGKSLTLSQLERQYQDWIFQMHDHYDEEIDCGEDRPLLIVAPSNKKGLGISSDVIRVHKVIQRKGTIWKSGLKIKVLKGACAGFHKNNVYATLEYILLEGFQGDAGGEARLICRPIGHPDENGCLLEVNNGNASLDIRNSISLPINVIDSGKCLAIEKAEWECQLEKQRLKSPSFIDILSVRHCQELGVEGALPVDAIVAGGHDPPDEIVAVVRPASFSSSSSCKNLDQKYMVKEHLEMALSVKFGDEHIHSVCVTPSSRKGLQGLYIFPLRYKLPWIFQRAGVYMFSFSIRGLSCRICEKRVEVRALSEVARWGLLSDEQNEQACIRVGSCFPSLYIACYDKYDNRIPFKSIPEVMVKLISNSGFLAHLDKMKVYPSPKKLFLHVKDILMESSKLDMIRPSYEAILIICSSCESFSVRIPCQVIPGSLDHVTVQPPNLEKQLLPGHVIDELILEMFDAYGNHVKEGTKILFEVSGLCFHDKADYTRKVNNHGCIDLSGLLKVTAGYGKTVSISVLYGKKVVLKEEFQTEKRALRAASRVPKSCTAGSQLENVVFEIINSNGDVDESIHDEGGHGQSHMLTIKSESLETDDHVQYSFRCGRCTVRAISIPQREGIFCLVAAHSRFPELHLRIEVHVEQAPKLEYKSLRSQCSDGKILSLQDSSLLKAPKVEQIDVHPEYSEGRILLLQNSPDPKGEENFVCSIMNEQKELEADIYRYGLCVGERESKLKMLSIEQKGIELTISELQARMDNDFCNDLSYFPEKDEMMDRIECKGDSAAAAVCKLFREFPFQEQHNDFVKHILGVVALLGTVQTYELSRILSVYLGADQMLAVVCKSYASAGALEMYEQNGNVNDARGLHAWATKVGKCIDGHYLVMCLEDIRPYMGELENGAQRKLALQYPSLPSGKTPPGYLGFAVNMIHLDVHHLHMRTAGGHSLRETLFYRLFGKLQVYETRKHMKMASSCIEQGAVSLDGGVTRGNGIISLGYGEPYIHFPVVTPGSQMQCGEIRNRIEEKKSELRATLGAIERENKSFVEARKKFRETKERYERRFLNEKGPYLGRLEYKPNRDGSNNFA